MGYDEDSRRLLQEDSTCYLLLLLYMAETINLLDWAGLIWTRYTAVKRCLCIQKRSRFLVLATQSDVLLAGKGYNKSVRYHEKSLTCMGNVYV